MKPFLHDPSIHAYDQTVASWWEASAGDPVAAPPLLAPARADVAIIGGGFTGLNAALALAEGGVAPLVLEAGPIGWGASGRNGGFCCLGSAKLSWERIIARFGLAEAQRFFRLQVDAIGHVRDLLARHGIEAETGPAGEAVLSHHPRAIADLKAERDLYRRVFATECTLLSKADLAARGLSTAEAEAGLWVPHGFPLHPLKYLRGLARAVQARGIALHGHSPVIAWTREGRRHRLLTPGGSVLADRVVVATAGFTRDDLHPGLAGRLLPVLSNIVVTRPLSAAERAAQGFDSLTMCADTRHLLHYFRLLPDGRLMFGARGGVSAAPTAEPAMRARLQADLARMFPHFAGAAITHFWRGLTDLAYDLLPHRGTVEDGSVHYLLAFHGNGVAMGSYGGALLGRALAGETVALPAPIRQPLPHFPFPALRQSYLRAAYAGFGLRDRLGR
ncbi:NAD(P)/FAD-dependent oxidoreductase [Zavarzinia compransoris]|uniref:FAD-dependent oxidoreductase n=1 Tax=Zavarzinia compransoris TaxID=1264899 RepID=A0A317E5M3_9PROT|nr:FAD-binding oxidoreductase [Zavarzinia compransoris]PWR22319.1 FAD-dependent oxidoreductase [Zavarzinia compransoris]TDP46916.1 glycine/D-amino acid oxidase-like deaminating enzyme [Zavarzinia compransoris]